MLNCREATRLFSEAQERPLSLSERLQLQLHISLCTGCRRFGQQLGSLRHITRAYVRGENEPPKSEE